MKFINNRRNPTKLTASGLGLKGKQNKYKFGRKIFGYEIFLSKRTEWHTEFTRRKNFYLIK